MKEFIANMKYDFAETSIERAKHGPRRSANGYRGFMNDTSDSTHNFNKRTSQDKPGAKVQTPVTTKRLQRSDEESYDSKTLAPGSGTNIGFKSTGKRYGRVADPSQDTLSEGLTMKRNNTVQNGSSGGYME